MASEFVLLMDSVNFTLHLQHPWCDTVTCWQQIRCYALMGFGSWTFQP